MENKLNTNPWLSIWTKPRQTIQEIVNFNPRFRFVTLSFVYGFPLVLSGAQRMSVGESWSLSFVIIMSLVLAIPIGAIALSFYSLLLLWTGKLLKGGATYYQIRSAVSWSNVPTLFNCAMWVIFLAMFGGRLFQAGFPEFPLAGAEAFVFMGLMLITLVTSVWGFIILLLTLGQVQGYSAWMALLNVVFIFLILIGVSYIINLLTTFFYVS